MSDIMERARQRQQLMSDLRRNRAMQRQERQQSRRDVANVGVTNRLQERTAENMRSQGYSPASVNATRYGDSYAQYRDRSEGYANQSAQRGYLNDMGIAARDSAQGQYLSGYGDSIAPKYRLAGEQYTADAGERNNYRDNYTADLSSYRNYDATLRGQNSAERIASIEQTAPIMQQQIEGRRQAVDESLVGRSYDPNTYVGGGNFAPIPRTSIVEGAMTPMLDEKGKPIMDDKGNAIMTSPEQRVVDDLSAFRQNSDRAMRERVANENPQYEGESDAEYLARLQSILSRR
jgi:hypothetical protein